LTIFIIQVWDSRAPTSVTGEQQQEVANGKPKITVPNGVNGELKAPTGNGAAPVATYASKVTQSAPEKHVLANGVAAKTG
jgi:YTH domain-containing family protein